jgi:hypothetical protein
VYTKIFQQIHDSTLCLNGPWEAMVTFMQMLILSDPEGVIDMPAGAIARRTGIPLEIIEKGIAVLEQPDPNSRRPDNEGRRIIRLDDHRTWGWQITNYVHYRDMQDNEERREYFKNYKRKYRKDKKNSQNVDKSSLSTEEDVDVKEDNTFANFWSVWPSSPRKVAKAACRKKWSVLKIDHDTMLKIIDHVRLMVGTKQWQTGFEPAPLTYLNQRRWEDPIHADGGRSMADQFPGAIR